jgi:hypothetical protein
VVPWLIFLTADRLVTAQVSLGWSFILISLASLGGGLLVAGLLTGPEYLLQVRQFRGVKVAFLLPLLLSGISYLQAYWQEGKEVDWKGFLAAPITRGQLILVTVAVVLGVIYIFRTGNLAPALVSRPEVIIRQGLEKLFPVRPRFKSFLIGHPLLLLGLDYSRRKGSQSWLLLPGLIGPINIINTFSHLHTPLAISLLRVGEGLLLGAGLGLVLIKLSHMLRGN